MHWGEARGTRGVRAPWGCRSAAACTAAALAIFATPPAAACLAPPLSLDGYPRDGDVEVPTDVVPFYQASTSDLAALTRAQFTLTSATAETIVARAVETQLFTADLTLEKELEPTTTYTLVAVIDAAASPTGATETLSLSFTTGAARSERAGGSPVLLQHYQLAQPPRSLCGPAVAGTCVAVPPGVVVESRLVARGSDAGNGVIELHRDSWFTSFSGIAPGTDFDCLKLRTRAANATYSLPYYVCRSDTGVVPISGSENIACTSQGITQDGVALPRVAPIGPNEGGGSTGDPDSAGTGAAGGASGASGSASASSGVPGSSGAAGGGAPRTPAAASASCSVGRPGPRSQSVAIGGWFALAWAARFSRRTRRLRVRRGAGHATPHEVQRRTRDRPPFTSRD